jgi:hypothetical protein
MPTVWYPLLKKFLIKLLAWKCMYRVMVGKCDGKRSLRRPRSKWKEKY